MPDAKPSDFAAFRAFAASIGRDPLLAQGAGGNISLKDGGTLWVKASGTWLRDAESKDIFVAVDQRDALKQIEAGHEPEYKRLDTDASLRPSIETSLHVALPQRVVAHVHSVPAMTLAVRFHAKALAQKAIPIPFTFVPYVKPGWPVTQELRKAMGHAPGNVFLLGSHGLIVAGEKVEEVERLLEDFDKYLDTPPREAPAHDTQFLKSATGTKWRLPQSAAVHSLATDLISRKFATGGTLYPDHAVFLGRGCTVISAEQINAADPSKQPMILIEGKGVLLAAGLPAGGEAMAECLAAVLSRIPAEAHLNYLTASQEDELLNWDAEKFRQTIK